MTSNRAIRRITLTVLVSSLGMLAVGCGKVERPDPEETTDDGDDLGDDGEDVGDDGEDVGDDGDDGDGGQVERCVGTGGERIRRVIRRHDDGTSEVVGLHDAMFGGRCRFTPDRDGTMRCLPVHDDRPFGIATRYYTDASCTNLIARFSTFSSGEVPGYAVFFESGTCSTRYFYHQIGSQLSFPPKTPLYYSLGGVCNATVVDTSPGVSYYAVTGEITLDRFVAGTERASDGGRLGARMIDGDDGSRICDRDALFDSELGGHRCEAIAGEDRSLRCLPLPNQVVDLSNDAGCGATFEAAEIMTACDLGFDYVREPTDATCFRRFRVRELGEPVTGTVYRDGFDGCELAPAGREYFAPGGVAEPSRFAELVEERASTGGRLEQIELVGDGIRIGRQLWYDTEMEAECQFRDANGVLRCIPGPISTQALYANYYADNLCAGPRLEVASFSDSCGDLDPPRYAVRPQGGLRVYHLGEPLRQRLYSGDPKFCSAVPDTVSVWTLGAEISLTSFVAGADVVE